jgi:hypothetical protein
VEELNQKTLEIFQLLLASMSISNCLTRVSVDGIIPRILGNIFDGDGGCVVAF